MRLAELLENIAYEGSPDVGTEIISVCAKLEDVSRGALFVAICGNKTDGHTLIYQAIERGAVCIICEKKLEVPRNISFVRVDSTRHTLAVICSRFYGKPSEKLKMIGVTGTNGKTTTVNMIAHILRQAGNKCGVIGTLGADTGEDAYQSDGLTTPEPAVLFRLLDEFVQSGCEYCVMEVSSQGLHQRRVDGIAFDIGVFTNLSAEHLDYHGTVSEYMRIKLMLAAMSDKMIVNLDDRYSKVFNHHMSVVTCSLSDSANYIAANATHTINGTTFEVNGNIVTLCVAGSYNVYNALLAIAVGCESGIALDKACEYMSSFQRVTGRTEFVDIDAPFKVMIDFAHTPESLRQLLISVREYTTGRIILVFGCGGDRDKTKRPVMGQIASQYADAVIVTSDNPRNEDPMSIIRDIVSGAESSYIIIEDRFMAIKFAIELAENDDIVILAGKGHEQYQIINDKKYEFNEIEAVKEIYSRRCGR